MDEDNKKNDQLLFSQGLKNLKFSNVNNVEKIYKSIYRPRKMSRKQLRTAMKNPQENANKLQEISEILKHSNGMLKEFILYKSMILTYDHFIVPKDMSKYKAYEDMFNEEYKAALYLEKFKIKFNAKWMAERILSNGELYIYKREDSDSILIQEMPSDKCKIVGKNNNMVSKYAIKLSAISDAELSFYPQEIQNLYMANKDGKLINDKNLLEGGYYRLDKNASAFNLETWASKGVPYYAHIFDSLMALEDMDDIQDQNAKLDNFKLLHQLADTDDDGNLLLEREVLENYHEAIKETVPNGIGVITTPMPVNPVTLGDEKVKTMDYINKIKEGIYDSSGINNELFNGNRSTNEAIAIGSVVDILISLKIQDMICNWINDELNQRKETKNWGITFVKTSEYNQRQAVQDERENLSLYGSRKKYLATQGFTPLQVMNITKNEKLLGLEDSLMPMQTSHTLSKKGKGRPSNSETNEKNTQTGENQESDF
ncbi:hypothetical protein [Metaclostridioides mangenotii]|uniref:hypothetical protein n=1 Tax=Metaclostridioides mangenotii TaxID=1540 RepID=UPI00046419EE|nr:hypothetical protein [Clostridioides mangenotii]